MKTAYTMLDLTHERALAHRATLEALVLGFLVAAFTFTVRAEVVIAASVVLVIAARLLCGVTARQVLEVIDKRVLGFALAVAAVWLVGIVHGLIMGWPVQHVMRNFFGLALFLPALLLAAAVLDRRGIARLVTLAAGFSLALLVALRIGSIADVLPLGVFRVLNLPVGMSGVGIRIYSLSALLIFGWLAIVAAQLQTAIRERDRKSILVKAVLALAILLGLEFVAESKGFLLGSFAVLLVPVIVQASRWRLRPLADIVYLVTAVALFSLSFTLARVVEARLAALILPPPVVTSPVEAAKPGHTGGDASAPSSAPTAVTAPPPQPELPPVPGCGGLYRTPTDMATATTGEKRFGLLGAFDRIFGASSPGNCERYEQIRELLGDTALWGRGLGAPVSSGYSRSKDFPYGFELSYLNVGHKLGLLSLVYFAFLGYSIYRILRSQMPMLERCCALGCLGYMVPSLGNPILLSAQAVVLHMLALHAMTRHSPPHLDGAPA